MSDFFVRPGSIGEFEFENFPPGLTYPQLGWQITKPDGSTDTARNGAYMTEEPPLSGRYIIRPPVSSSHVQGDDYLVTLDYNNGSLVPGAFRTGTLEYGFVPLELLTEPDPPDSDLLKDLRIAVADAITLAIPDIQAVPLMISNPTPPHAYVYPGPATYDLAMGRGLDDLELRVRAYIGQTSDQAAQLRLDELIEPGGGRSMKAAIEADTTLGGLVGYGGCRVTSNSGYQQYQIEGKGPYLGSEWTLKIYASGG